MLPGSRGTGSPPPGAPSSGPAAPGWSQLLRRDRQSLIWAAEEVGVQLFYQLSFHSADPFAGLSLRDGGGTQAGKISIEGQIADENDINSTWGQPTFGEKLQRLGFPVRLHFFGLAFSFKKKTHPCLECMLNDL